jgi:hypothetical protein
MTEISRFARRHHDWHDDHLLPQAGPISSGALAPAPEAPRDSRANEFVRRSIGESARLPGVDRRRFLQGVGAVAASFAAFDLAGCSSATTRSGRQPNVIPRRGRRPNVILFGEGPHGPYPNSDTGNSPYTATQLAEIRSYGFGSFTMQAGLFLGQAGTNPGQPGFKWSAHPDSSDSGYDQQFLYGQAGAAGSVSTMAHAVGLKVYLYCYLAAVATAGIASQNLPPCAGNWSNDADWNNYNTLMENLGGAIAWMGFDGILWDTEVERQDWQWTGLGGLSSHALTNTLVASRGKAMMRAINTGAGFQVPMFTYMSEPQAAQIPGCYMQYLEAYNGNNTPVAEAITNSVYPAFIYGWSQGTSGPIVSGDPAFYYVASVCGGASPYGTGATTGAGATTSWNEALNMNLNGGPTYNGVTYQGFKKFRVNLSGTPTPLPSNAYITPILWLGDNDMHVWSTAEFGTALPPILNHVQHNTYMIFQGAKWIDYAENTNTSPPADYTPLNR